MNLFTWMKELYQFGSKGRKEVGLLKVELDVGYMKGFLAGFEGAISLAELSIKQSEKVKCPAANKKTAVKARAPINSARTKQTKIATSKQAPTKPKNAAQKTLRAR